MDIKCTQGQRAARLEHGRKQCYLLSKLIDSKNKLSVYRRCLKLSTGTYLMVHMCARAGMGEGK